MAEARPRGTKRLTLDTNVFFDLAAGEDFAHDFLETTRQCGYSLYAPPTVIAELDFKYECGTREESRTALNALTGFREWRIGTYSLSGASQAISEGFSDYIRHTLRLLPVEEDHDARVLAETSLHEIPVLITSDVHLLEIDPDRLLLALHDRGLWDVHVMSPRRFTRALGR